MSKIKSLMAKETSSWVAFPDIEEFEVHLRFLSREDLLKIRSSSLTYKFSKKTRQKEEEVDNDKFLQNYAEKAILGWKGFKIKHLPELLPVDISNSNPEELIPFDIEDAAELLKNSTIFDQFVTDSMNDFDNFSTTKMAEQAKN